MEALEQAPPRASPQPGGNRRRPGGLASDDRQPPIPALSLWDWVSHKRWTVFPFALVVLLAYHWSFLYGYQFAAWQRVCAWFVAL